MAIKGKRQYTLYLDEENTEYVKEFLLTTKHQGGLSGIVDAHLSSMAKTLKASKYLPGEKLTAAKLFRIFRNGLKQEPA